MSKYTQQPTASQGKADDLKNTLGQVAATPFYIWANEGCDNKTDSFKEAKAIRLALFNEGGESVHIVDADGVEVVDAEIEAHEALVNAGYYAGARKPDVKPEFPGAFMVNDPLDPDGYAIVGDDIAALILEARGHLLEPASERKGKMSNYIEQTAEAKPLGDLYANWDRFADVPVSEDGAIEAPFLHFAVGAERETIWRWFESQNTRFIVGDVMNGIRHEDERKMLNNKDQRAVALYARKNSETCTNMPIWP